MPPSHHSLDPIPPAGRPLHLRSNSHSIAVPLIILGALLVVAAIASIASGAAVVRIDDVATVIRAHFPGGPLQPVDPRLDAIVWQGRVPRTLSAIGIGAILGVSGVALQAMVRNPLAEPYVLGVSSGAGCGAALGIIVFALSSTWLVSALAFLGAVAATGLVLLAGGQRGAGALRLILSGLAVTFTFQSLTNLVVLSAQSPESARAVMFWMLGSLTKARWDYAPTLILVAITTTVLFWVCAPILDALASGDSTALSIGVNPDRARLLLTLCVSAAVAIAVASAGGIGFVGLLIPHLCRMLVGPAHRRLIPVTALAAALALCLADTVARTAFVPAEIPIGIITGLIGAPFFLLVVRSTGEAQ